MILHILILVLLFVLHKNVSLNTFLYNIVLNKQGCDIKVVTEEGFSHIDFYVVNYSLASNFVYIWYFACCSMREIATRSLDIQDPGYCAWFLQSLEGRVVSVLSIWIIQVATGKKYFSIYLICSMAYFLIILYYWMIH